MLKAFKVTAPNKANADHNRLVGYLVAIQRDTAAALLSDFIASAFKQIYKLTSFCRDIAQSAGGLTNQKMNSYEALLLKAYNFQVKTTLRCN